MSQPEPEIRRPVEEFGIFPSDKDFAKWIGGGATADLSRTGFEMGDPTVRRRPKPPPSPITPRRP